MMVVKYGKTVDMRNIHRDISNIGEMVKKAKETMEKHYRESGGVNPRCRICGSKKGTLFMRLLGKYDYYQCAQCGALFLGTLPDIKSMYCGEEAENCDSYIDGAVYDKRVEMISAPKVRFVLDACHEEDSIKIDSWLDIGCGGGEILSWLSCNSDIRAEGIESDEKECRFANSKGLNVQNHYIDLNQEDSQVDEMIHRNDVVSFFNVLEHLEEPARFMDYIYAHMHENSILAFEVPRYPSAASFANMTCSDIAYRHISSPGHLQIFSEKSIEMMLQNKFRIIGKWEFGQGYTDVINNAMLMSGKKQDMIYDRLISLSNIIQPIFDEQGLADQVLVVAVKV